MSINIAEKLSIRVMYDDRCSSGIVYPNETHTYVITAKHSICKKNASECWETKNLKCENCPNASTLKTKIILDRPDIENYKKMHVKDVIFCEDKDIAILVVQDNCHKNLIELPKVKIVLDKDIAADISLYSCGYPNILGGNELQPIVYNQFSTFKKKFHVSISGDTISNLNPSKENMSGNSGAGILKQHNEFGLLLGIYTDTAELGSGFGEFIDSNINDVLIEKGYPKFEFTNETTGFKSLIKHKFTECFSKIEHEIKFPTNRELNLYRLALDGKKYDYDLINRRLIDCIPNFTLSRKQLKKIEISDEFNLCIHQSFKHFVKLESNEKLPEIMLQGFLETYCKAPKLYSSHQNEKSVFQGAHIRFEDNCKKVEIIHCIALFSKDLKECFKVAIEEIISKFPDLKPFGGLVDNGFLDNIYTEEECEVLAKLIIPKENGVNYSHTDRIAIFIGYDRNIESSFQFLQQENFRMKLEEHIVNDIIQSMQQFEDNFDQIQMLDAVIDCFFVPFEDTVKFKTEFIESL